MITPTAGTTTAANRAPSCGMHARLPQTKQASLLVAIRVRPMVAAEAAKGGRKDIIRVLDNKMGPSVVLVLDPDDSKVGDEAAGSACALPQPASHPRPPRSQWRAGCTQALALLARAAGVPGRRAGPQQGEALRLRCGARHAGEQQGRV
jgi:hypothetical protein